MGIVSENAEGLDTGIGDHCEKGTRDEIVIANQIVTRKGCERAIRYAFDVATKRAKKKKVTVVDKANAIETQQLWRRTAEEVSADYPGIELDFAYIDAACMWMVKNPEAFDVIVTPNLFGDIITDLGAMVQGGMGIAASGNIHPGQVSLFEPIHGSAPKYKGKGVVSPLAAIAAVGMLLDFLGETPAAAAIERAIAGLLTSRRIASLDASSGLSTSQVGDMVSAELGARMATAAAG